MSTVSKNVGKSPQKLADEWDEAACNTIGDILLESESADDAYAKGKLFFEVEWSRMLRRALGSDPWERSRCSFTRDVLCWSLEIADPRELLGEVGEAVYDMLRKLEPASPDLPILRAYFIELLY